MLSAVRRRGSRLERKKRPAVLACGACRISIVAISGAKAPNYFVRLFRGLKAPAPSHLAALHAADHCMERTALALAGDLWLGSVVAPGRKPRSIFVRLFRGLKAPAPSHVALRATAYLACETCGDLVGRVAVSHSSLRDEWELAFGVGKESKRGRVCKLLDCGVTRCGGPGLG